MKTSFDVILEIANKMMADGKNFPEIADTLHGEVSDVIWKLSGWLPEKEIE